jgi:hypothetical protein
MTFPYLAPLGSASRRYKCGGGPVRVQQLTDDAGLVDGIACNAKWVRRSTASKASALSAARRSSRAGRSGTRRW